LDREEQPLDVRVEGLVVVLLGDASQRDKSAESDIGEEDINSALRFDALIETIEVSQVRNVTLNARDVAAMAIPSGSAMRPIETVDTMRAMASGGWSATCGVTTGPGLSQPVSADQSARFPRFCSAATKAKLRRVGRPLHSRISFRSDVPFAPVPVVAI
jgi:hypothetical protein